MLAEQPIAHPKAYSKAWLKMVVSSVEEGNSSPTYLLNCIKEYIAHLDNIDANRGGKGKASEKRIAANRINAKKGGWKKGVPRKKVESENQ